MKILLTGHLGFIGSDLYNELIKEHTVIGIDIKDGKDLLTCDLNYTVDLVIHLAGIASVRDSLKDPLKYWHNNVLASQKVFDSFKDTRIIYASSSSAVEPSLNPYGFSKFALEKIAPKNSLGLRFTTVWAEDGRSDMFMSKLFKNNIQYITNHHRDFVHVSDIISAIKLLMNKDITGVMDVGTGISNSLKILVDLAGIKNYESKLGDVYERMDNCADIKELRDLGWEPKVNVINYIKNKYHLTS
jgi:nucleoside-diphosphate-sugar epimerase